jgi:hypothetical protein
MGKFINLNNTHVINVSEIQSIQFKSKDLDVLSASSKLAKRYTQLTGRDLPRHPGIRIDGTYDQIEIELKSGHVILIEDFSLRELREYLLSLLESVRYFECGEIKYTKPDSSLSIDGELSVDGSIEVKAQLENGNYPLGIAFKRSETLDVRIDQ